MGDPIVLDLPVPRAGYLRRRDRRAHQLVVTDDALAFRVDGVDAWRVGWTTIGSAQVVDVHDPATGLQSARLVLELTDPPAHPSLHRHEGRHWFLLTGTDVPARLDRHLGEHLGPRRRRAEVREAPLTEAPPGPWGG